MMTFNRGELVHLEERAEKGLQELTDAVTEMLPKGTRVDYLTAGRWIGPCEVEAVDQFVTSVYGPGVNVRNLRTGKLRRICSVNYIRPHGAGGAQ